jgi:uncharacterized delta-60 repeat protein
MGRRGGHLVSIGLALLALCGAGEAAAAATPVATLDPSFGSGGVVTLPAEPLAGGAHGVLVKDGDIIVSGGPTFQALTGAGTLDPSFGAGGTVTPAPAAGAKFWLADFTVDAQGRLLAVGTSAFPAAKSIPSTGSGTPVTEPAAIRVLRFLPDGAPDPSFGQDGVVETDLGLPPPRDEHGKALQPQASVHAGGIAVDRQSRIVVTGYAAVELGPSCEHDIFNPLMDSVGFVTRMTAAGSPDPSFGGDGLVGGRELGETPLHGEGFGPPVVSPDGTITYSSEGARCPGVGRRGLAQLTPSGRVKKGVGKKGVVGGDFAALAAKPDGSVIALALIPEGEYFGGRVIRIVPGGKVARSFGHHGGTAIRLGGRRGDEPNALVIDRRGRIYVGGTFVSRKRRGMFVSRLRADGRQEMSFGPHGRVVVPVPGPEPFGRGGLLLDGEGRVITMHPYSSENFDASGIVLARFLLRN